MISETTIRKVRELAIEDVLSPYVRLSRKGSTLMGLCPFHSEKTGSFAVTPSKNLFHCFSCNRGGDSITFIMEKENLSFSAAVEFIAAQHLKAFGFGRAGPAHHPARARAGAQLAATEPSHRSPWACSARRCTRRRFSPYRAPALAARPSQTVCAL